MHSNPPLESAPGQYAVMSHTQSELRHAVRQAESRLCTMCVTAYWLYPAACVSSTPPSPLPALTYQPSQYITVSSSLPCLTQYCSKRLPRTIPMTVPTCILTRHTQHRPPPPMCLFSNRKGYRLPGQTASGKGFVFSIAFRRYSCCRSLKH